jgi:sugar lactone lactonase YvrE
VRWEFQRRRWIVLGLFGALVLYLGAWPVPIQPVAWQPSLAPALAGEYAPNQRLTGADVVAVVGEGPEDVVLGPDGAWYSGLRDGRIVRVVPVDRSPRDFASTGGRPLGLAFDSQGYLLVADAKRGLLRIDRDGVIEVLVDEVEGTPVLFADEVAIGADGIVWFTDASMRFGVDEFLTDALESRPTGRLIAYDPSTGSARVVLGELHFANGVAIAEDGASVFVVETFSYRITRVWVTGERAGTSEPFVENLPGFPDNIALGDDGTMWVALAAPRNALLDRLAPHPWARKVVARLPDAIRPKPQRYGLVLGLGPDGTVRHNLHDPSGRWAMLTSAVPIGDELALGSLHGHAIGRVPIAPGS